MNNELPTMNYYANLSAIALAKAEQTQSKPISNVLPYCSAQAGKFRRNDKNVGRQAKWI